MKLLIIGGVAGGASAAAKARRVDENAEIIMFERGEYISFANCGLPYHVGKIIPSRDSLELMTPESFTARANVDVRVKQEVIAINPAEKTVEVKNHATGETYSETYDKLILAPGSSPIQPPIKGADLPGVKVLWTLPDMDAIIEQVKSGVKSAVVVGGGFIGIEVAENLQERGIKTALVEMAPQLMPPIDQEMAQPLSDVMSENGVELHLNSAVTAIEEIKNGDALMSITLKDGKKLVTDLIVLAVGVKPNSELAVKAGLTTNQRGGVVVNDMMQTSDENIYAVGDAVEVDDPILNRRVMIPLAGPANKQGRAAAINVFGGNEHYRGSIGTSVCKVFSMTVAATGVNERTLKAEGIEYKKLYLNPANHATYYPGAEMMHMKVLYRPDETILGAQIVGHDGVDKRIDLLATAIKTGIKITELEHLELAYAPPYGSAKDPVNFVGFMAANEFAGEADFIAPDELKDDDFILDVRDSAEVECGAVDGATNIPLEELRNRLGELKKDQEIIIMCKTGVRAYLAERILKQAGFKVKNLSGGYVTWKMFNPEAPGHHTFSPCGSNQCDTDFGDPLSRTQHPVMKEIDACGLQCPGPIVQVKQAMEELKSGDTLRVKASDAGFKKDLPAWCSSTGNVLVSIEDRNGIIEAIVGKGGTTVTTTTKSPINKQTTIVLFSNDLDKSMAAFIMATGFASLGHEVSIFFTFWGLNVLRKDNPPPVKKDILSRMFGMMMPRGPKKLSLSKMHMAGMGTAMMKYVMDSKNVDSLPVLIEQSQQLGVKFLACDMAMNVMGISPEELIDNVERVGVANFAALSEQSSTTLFI
jgi:NADPH-dependent 2,4-dienoyl-CoA reductase/sulfur reductase-like enzyme/peroxiredoxin family protein/TusA-related sulfurtransferase/rhodanese-related sulfurtransferase